MALNDTPNKLESVWIQRNAENQYYEQINISGSNLIVYHSSSGELQADKISDFLSKYGGGGGTKVKITENDTTSDYLYYKLDSGNNVSFSIINPGANETLQINVPTASFTASFIPFNGNRSITRSPYAGVNLGTDGVVAFLNAFFFPFVSATISINSTTVYYETGSSQNVTVNGSITANTETLFYSGSIRRGGYDWYTFTSASSYTTTETGVSSSRIYQSFMQVGNNGSPTLIQSTAKSVSFILPYLWGISTTAGLSGNSLYTELAANKSITTQATKSPSFSGISTYIYFAYPATYTDLTSIKDPNNFEILSSFERSGSVQVTSSGLTHNWMAIYKVYRLKLQANPNGTYIFYH